jgi:hypothetical protein
MAEDKKYHVVHLQDYVSPRIVDEVGQKWVLWGGNNSFYQHLRDLYLNSTTNNSCINGIHQLAYGTGVHFDAESQAMKFAGLIEANDIKRLLLQFYIYNKLCVQVEYHMVKKGKKQVRDESKGIKRLWFYPAKKIGFGKKNELDEIDTYYVCPDWSKRDNGGKYKPKPVPAYGYGSELDEVELYVYQSEFDDDEYFAPVNYHGGLQYAECEVEQSNYHLNHLLNGFTTNAVVNFNNGVPSADQRREITRDFKRTKTGSKNAGKPFITFNEGSENAVTIESYDIPDPHRQYEFINRISRKAVKQMI